MSLQRFSIIGLLLALVISPALAATTPLAGFEEEIVPTPVSTPPAGYEQEITPTTASRPAAKPPAGFEEDIVPYVPDDSKPMQRPTPPAGFEEEIKPVRPTPPPPRPATPPAGFEEVIEPAGGAPGALPGIPEPPAGFEEVIEPTEEAEEGPTAPLPEPPRLTPQERQQQHTERLENVRAYVEQFVQQADRGPERRADEPERPVPRPERRVLTIDTNTDSDGDGLTDEVEARIGTNPILNRGTAVSRALQISDSTRAILLPIVETLELAVPARRVRIASITNLNNEDILTDLTPSIFGSVSRGARQVTVEAIAVDGDGAPITLGVVDSFSDFEASEVVNGQLKYFHLSEASYAGKLKDHRAYYIKVRTAMADGSTVESSPVRIELDSGIKVSPPQLIAFGDADVPKEIRTARTGSAASPLIIREGEPVLRGTTDYGTQVFAVWESVVLASSVISDSEKGSFEIRAPKQLAADESHKVTLYAIRELNDKKVRSDDVTIHFRIDRPAFSAPLAGGVLALIAALAVIVILILKRKRGHDLLPNL